MLYKTPYLETERLILKTGTRSDFKKVYEYDFTKLRDINGEFEFVKLDPASSFFNGIENYALETENVFDWIIYLKESNEPIGNIMADREDTKIKATELAYNLHPKYWRNGYMKEAVIEVMNYLFDFGFENVLCGYSEGNIKSKKLNEKIGFELYSIEENAWIKDGVPITDYKTIMSRDKYYELYPKEKTK